MNPSQIYKQATTPKVVKDALEQDLQKAGDLKEFTQGYSQQLRDVWLQDPFTVALIKHINDRYEDIISQVVDQSDSSSCDKLHQQNLLVESKTLNAIKIHIYGKSRL